MNKHLFSLLGIIAFSFSVNAQLDVATVWASPAFMQKNVDQVASLHDGEHYTVLENNEQGQPEINKYSFKTFKKVATIVAAGDVLWNEIPLDFKSYEFNSDETKLLLTTEQHYIYRRSFTSNYYVYDIKTKSIRALSDPKKGEQQLADISPDGKKVAFVRDNNIFYMDIATGAEVQVTDNGKRNAIINGGTDWVYEEEFEIIKGFHWSPDSKTIAYLTFDETNVKEFQFDKYGTLYPEHYTYKYPKAGEDNSRISLTLYDLDSKTSWAVITGEDPDIYLPRMAWDPKKNALVILRMNRLQNKLEYCLVDATGDSPVLRPFYTETSETYVEVTNDLIFLTKQEGLIRTSEKDGFNHIYKIDYTGKETQITKGNWDVIELIGIDENGGWVYYASAESGPTQKEIFRIKFDGSSKTKLSKRTGTNTAFFSTGMKYFINYNSSANVPVYITLHTADGKELKVLEDNAALVSGLANYNLSRKEFLKFKTSQDVELNAWIIKPKNFDATKKYPVYLTFYCGPGRNEVTDSWGGLNYGWHQLLAQKGYIVFCVDPRGTMYRGEKFKKCTYLQLGKYETEDLIETAKYLAKQPYVDGSRIGVQGWSYGGYMTLLAMTKGADYFKAGISVAPVTNWRYYDNIYTERFMRKPQDNASGYDDNSPINHVSKLKGKLLLIHGSADDNVHFQNSMEITNAFIKANKQFDMFIYPNKAHGISGVKYHLYTKMLNFIETNL